MRDDPVQGIHEPLSALNVWADFLLVPVHDKEGNRRSLPFDTPESLRRIEPYVILSWQGTHAREDGFPKTFAPGGNCVGIVGSLCKGFVRPVRPGESSDPDSPTG